MQFTSSSNHTLKYARLGEGLACNYALAGRLSEVWTTYFGLSCTIALAIGRLLMPGAVAGLAPSSPLGPAFRTQKQAQLRLAARGSQICATLTIMTPVAGTWQSSPTPCSSEILVWLPSPGVTEVRSRRRHWLLFPQYEHTPKLQDWSGNRMTV
ncbi:hypothetical protein EJ07DRAFT_159453 [Lizonia empirigonia]|nr:hypothetical protein EJ07DRAFT_159453 [Lizonia empirigonia]